MSGYQIAQLNLGRAVASLDEPAMAGFVARLDEINALAERSAGFVWRLQGENGSATDLPVTDDPLVISNLTVWETIDDLHAFTYRSDHRELVAQRFDWFERWDGPSTVLWWQSAGTVPTLPDALKRLQLLADRGPTQEAFTFKQRFPAPSFPVS